MQVANMYTFRCCKYLFIFYTATLFYTSYKTKDFKRKTMFGDTNKQNTRSIQYLELEF